MHRRILILLAALTVSSYLLAAETVVGSITRYGIYEMVGPPKGPWQVGAVAETTRIPAKRGLRFGVDFDVTGIAERTATVTATMHHPVITKPDGTTSTTIVEVMGPFDVAQGKLSSSFGFGFDHPYEMIPGDWRVEVVYRGRVVAKKTFTVFAEP